MIPSPCIKNCKLNSDNVCIGCHRTSEEIKIWPSLSDIEKKKIIDKNLIVDILDSELICNDKYKCLDLCESILCPVMYITKTLDWSTLCTFNLNANSYKISIEGMFVNYTDPYPENAHIIIRVYDDIYEWAVKTTFVNIHNHTATFSFDCNILGPGNFSLQYRMDCDTPKYLHNLCIKSV